MSRHDVFRLVALAVGAAMLTGCASSVSLPPESGAPDYQLGGPYSPAPSVEIIVRDRAAEPLEGVYSICYINAFQTQPGELDLWPDAQLLRGSDNEVVFDPAWPDEALLDTSSEPNREAIKKVVEPWIAECATAGFDAVEFDNLDSHTHSGGALTLEHNRALAADLVRTAHDAGLAAGQKNAAEDSASLRETAGFDFAIAEECAQFDECELYEREYGARVIDVEYADNLDVSFEQVCADPNSPASVVLRDRKLSTPDEGDFVFALCPASG